MTAKSCHRLPTTADQAPPTAYNLPPRADFAAQSRDPLLYPLSYGGARQRVAAARRAFLTASVGRTRKHRRGRKLPLQCRSKL